MGDDEQLDDVNEPCKEEAGAICVDYREATPVHLVHLKTTFYRERRRTYVLFSIYKYKKSVLSVLEHPET